MMRFFSLATRELLVGCWLVKEEHGWLFDECHSDAETSLLPTAGTRTTGVSTNGEAYLLDDSINCSGDGICKEIRLP